MPDLPSSTPDTDTPHFPCRSSVDLAGPMRRSLPLTPGKPHDMSLQTLFSSPQPTPTGCDREDALQAVEDRLEAKLQAEREQHRAGESGQAWQAEVCGWVRCCNA